MHLLTQQTDRARGHAPTNTIIVVVYLHRQQTKIAEQKRKCAGLLRCTSCEQESHIACICNPVKQADAVNMVLASACTTYLLSKTPNEFSAVCTEGWTAEVHKFKCVRAHCEVKGN